MWPIYVWNDHTRSWEYKCNILANSAHVAIKRYCARTGAKYMDVKTTKDNKMHFNDTNQNATQPRICPKSGMFIDEPEEKSTFWLSSNGGTTDCRYYGGEGYICKDLWELGNCFANREDAQRYANYLKAMAKLRRLGGIYGTKYGKLGCADALAYYVSSHEHEKLTPEEQNALLWPDEEKK